MHYVLHDVMHYALCTMFCTVYCTIVMHQVPPVMSALNLSPVLGFLFAGIVIGPSGLGLVSDVATTTKLAELGVVFFLFEMGLELELER